MAAISTLVESESPEAKSTQVTIFASPQKKWGDPRQGTAPEFAATTALTPLARGR